MERTEVVAILLVAAVLVGLPFGAMAYHTATMMPPATETTEVQAWAVENGGWAPRHIVVTAGEEVRLTVRSMDVTHSFVLLQLNVDSGPVKPGKAVDVAFTAPAPGAYAFACGVICSPRHGEMAGLLVVLEGPA
jgi:heme/copper-type cytochrome/quinol oxidase subunit 2